MREARTATLRVLHALTMVTAQRWRRHLAACLTQCSGLYEELTYIGNLQQGVFHVMPTLSTATNMF